MPTTTLTAVGAGKCQVGINYAWGFDKYGTYFGIHRTNPKLPQPPVQPANQFDRVDNEEIRFERWIMDGVQLDSKANPVLDAQGNQQIEINSFRRNLAELKKLGVSCVRIFLLCNAINWGQLDSAGQFQPPPYLHPRFRAHLVQMFTECSNAKIQVIPSLLDFGICQPSLEGSRRSRIVTDTNKKFSATDRAAGKLGVREIFLQQVLIPFLDDSVGFEDTILAWEVMNEPFWLSSSVFPQGNNRFHKEINLDPIPESDVDDFLNDAIAIIRGRSFTATVGHRFASDLLKGRPRGDRPQFHFYPNLLNPALSFRDTTFLSDPKVVGVRADLGEFAASDDDSDNWLELFRKDTPTARERVRERLLKAESKGFTLAMLWPDLDIGPKIPGFAEPLKYTAEAKQGILDFTGGKPGSGSP